MTDDQPNQTPAEALAAIEASRKRALARVAKGSWRYDLIYSAILAAMVGSQAMEMPLGAVGTSLGAVALAILARREADRLGVSITGLTPRRARWVAIGLGLVFVALIVAMILLKQFVADPLVFGFSVLGLMLLSFVFGLIGSRLWLRVYRRETGIVE